MGLWHQQCAPAAPAGEEESSVSIAINHQEGTEQPEKHTRIFFSWAPAHTSPGPELAGAGPPQARPSDLQVSHAQLPRDPSGPVTREHSPSHSARPPSGSSLLSCTLALPCCVHPSAPLDNAGNGPCWEGLMPQPLATCQITRVAPRSL